MKSHVFSLISAIVLSGVVLAVAGGIPFQAQESDSGAAGALEQFLRLDCGVDADGATLAAILALGDAIEPELERLLREGPDDAARADIRAIAEERWVRLESFLETNPHLGLDSQARLDVATLTRDLFVTREVDRFTFGYRERAVIGLAALGSPSAYRTLREVRDTADGELSAVIDGVLGRYEPATRGVNPIRRQRSGRPTSGRVPRHPVQD